MKNMRQYRMHLAAPLLARWHYPSRVRSRLQTPRADGRCHRSLPSTSKARVMLASKDIRPAFIRWVEVGNLGLFQANPTGEVSGYQLCPKHGPHCNLSHDELTCVFGHGDDCAAGPLSKDHSTAYRCEYCLWYCDVSDHLMIKMFVEFASTL
jgi:hypothetical protein